MELKEVYCDWRGEGRKAERDRAKKENTATRKPCKTSRACMFTLGGQEVLGGFLSHFVNLALQEKKKPPFSTISSAW